MSSRLSGVIPSFAATKPRVKTLEMEQPREESAPMPIIFGLLFEVHSGPADGVSSSLQGEGPLTPPTPPHPHPSPRVPSAFKMLTSCCIYVLHPFGFLSGRLTCERRDKGGANLWWGERKENKKISLAVWRSGSRWDSFSRTPGRPNRWSNTFRSLQKHTVK